MLKLGLGISPKPSDGIGDNQLQYTVPGGSQVTETPSEGEQ